MSKPINISPEAREAAASCYNKITNEVPGSLYALRHNEGVRLTVLRLLEESLQLAINAAVAEKDKEIERLQDALDMNNDEFQRIIAKLHENDDSDALEVVDICKRAKWKTEQTVPLITQRDTLTKQLAELREIAEGLADDVQKKSHALQVCWADASAIKTDWLIKNGASICAQAIMNIRKFGKQFEDKEALAHYIQWKEKNQ